MIGNICLNCHYNDDLLCSYCPLNEGYDNNFNFINTFESLINKENIDKISKHIITQKEYDFILERIISKGSDDLELNPEIPAIERISTIATKYTKIIYSPNDDHYGSYACNIIKINPKHSISKQIFTMIHELAHHLLNEIFEETIMYLLKVKKNHIIESFVQFILNMHDEGNVCSEFVAHNCENYYLPEGYSNYGSIIKFIIEYYKKDDDNKIPLESLDILLRYAKAIANDVIYILNHLIDDKLKEDICNQYIQDMHLDNNHRLDAKLLKQYTYLDEIKAVTNKEKLLSINDIFNIYSQEILDNKNLLINLKEVYKKFKYYENNY